MIRQYAVTMRGVLWMLGIFGYWVGVGYRHVGSYRTIDAGWLKVMWV